MVPNHKLSRAEKAAKELVNDAYTAGMLHDAGELVLAATCRQEFAHACNHAAEKNVPLPEAEREILGCSHAEIGAYLLGIWGLPHPIVEAVAYHHQPAKCLASGFSPLTAVHVADAFAWKSWGAELSYPVVGLDQGFLQRLHMQERLPDWQAACTTVESKKDE